MTKTFELDPITVNGQTFAVTCDKEGTFMTKDFAGEWVRDKALSGLKKKLKNFKGDLAIPITRITRHYSDDDLEVVTGTVVGIHGGNQNLIVEWDDNKGHRDQESRWSKHLRKLTDEERMQLTQLHTNKRVAGEAYDKFVEAHGFELPPNEQEKKGE